MSQVYQAQIPISGLPLSLVLISNGQVAICRQQNFKTIVCDYGVEGKIPATFCFDGFVIGKGEDSVDYQYDTTYVLADRTMLKEWLIQQELEAPQ